MSVPYEVLRPPRLLAPADGLDAGALHLGRADALGRADVSSVAG
jgi:hypothetical protein